MFEKDQQVQHPGFGTGSVILDQSGTVIVRFGDRIESCEAAMLTRRMALADAVRLGHWSPALEVTLKTQAAAIRSLNDAWGCSRAHGSICCRISFGFVIAPCNSGRSGS